MAADDLEWFESNSEEDDHFEKENTFVAESIGSRERNPSKKQETLDEQRRKRLVQWITFLQKETR